LALAAELGTFNFFHFDSRLRALVVLFRALWLRGFSDQALRLVQRAIDEAASRGHPVSVCISLLHASTLLLWVGDLPKVSDLIVQLIVHAGRYSLAPYRDLGIALKGELAVACDEPEAGLDLLRSALENLHAQQYNLFILDSIGALAEGLRKTGQFEEALLTINGAIARAKNSGVELDLSELLRIKSHGGLSAASLRGVQDYIHSNLPATITLVELSRVAGLSRRHFLRAFRESVGDTPLGYVRTLRIEEAKRRLSQGSQSITEVALDCGFSHAQHFATAFRRATGLTPSAFHRVCRF
jgi:AraC-like DNA-binding protein